MDTAKVAQDLSSTTASGMRVKVGPRPTPFSLGFCSRADLSLVDVAAGVDYVKDDGCGGPGINKTTGREITDSESQDLLRAGMSAGTPPGAEVMQFSVEGDPDLITLSADPDQHANTKRVGHDVVPMWGSMLTEIDIASGLWMWVLRSAEGKQSINSIGRDTYPFEIELRANAMQCNATYAGTLTTTRAKAASSTTWTW